MGFCSKKEHARFLELCPQIEKFLIEGGVTLLKLWLEVGNDEQKKRFEARIEDPAAAVEAQPDGSAVPHPVVRLLAGARSDAGEDRYENLAVVHRAIR